LHDRLFVSGIDQLDNSFGSRLHADIVRYAGGDEDLMWTPVLAPPLRW
jgi:hypothetical protein